MTVLKTATEPPSETEEREEVTEETLKASLFLTSCIALGYLASLNCLILNLRNAVAGTENARDLEPLIEHAIAHGARHATEGGKAIPAEMRNELDLLQKRFIELTRSATENLKPH